LELSLYMSTGFIINKKNELEEVRKKNFPEQPVVIKFIAKVISYVFHPVFVPVYIVLFMLYLHPYLFAGTTAWDKTKVILMAVLMFAFFPVVTVLLLKALDFIKSVYLVSQKDRIIPLVACGVWYFWITYIWWNSHKMDDGLHIPGEAVQLALAVFIASWLALMANIKMKISLHTISAGLMLTFILQLAFSDPLNYGIYIAIALLITGLVCTARFIASDHSAKEVYGGLVVGIFSQLIASLFT